MKSETSFIKLLEEHKRLFNQEYNMIIDDMIKRGQDHDMDKIYNQNTYNTYYKHFPELKKIEFGTQAYLDYEREYFWDAHMSHAQNRHHFYSPKNQSVPNPNLTDLLEAVVDIYVSNVQYNEQVEIEKVINVMKNKGIFNYTLEDYIYNSLKEMKDNEK